MKSKPHVLIAVPTGYRTPIADFCHKHHYHIVISEYAEEVRTIIETQNLTGIIIDSQWIDEVQPDSNDLIHVIRERFIPSVTMIRRGGNVDLKNWFHPPFHQYLAIPFDTDELRAMMSRAKMIYEHQNTHTLVFLWDDDHAIVALFTYFFRDRGYNTLVFHATTEIKRAIGQIENPVLVVRKRLSDKESVLPFCQELRGCNETKHIPIIVGHAEGKEKEAAFAVGVNGCFGIVCDIEGILRMIKTLEMNPSQVGLVDQ